MKVLDLVARATVILLVAVLVLSVAYTAGHVIVWWQCYRAVDSDIELTLECSGYLP